jgi:hypothetical protein
MKAKLLLFHIHKNCISQIPTNLICSFEKISCNNLSNCVMYQLLNNFTLTKVTILSYIHTYIHKILIEDVEEDFTKPNNLFRLNFANFSSLIFKRSQMVSAFSMFDGINYALDQQFNVLSRLKKEIVIKHTLIDNLQQELILTYIYRDARRFFW